MLIINVKQDIKSKARSNLSFHLHEATPYLRSLETSWWYRAGVVFWYKQSPDHAELYR